MSKKKILFVFEELTKLSSSRWKKLINNTNINNLKSTILAKNKMGNLILTSRNNEFRLLVFFKFFFNVFVFKERKIQYLINHPELCKGYKKLLPTFIKHLYINYLYLKLEKFFINTPVTDVFIMEPKNFLYSTFIIIIEIICNKLLINFTIIHTCFIMKNVNFYNSLTRKDTDLIHIFQNTNKHSYVDNNYFINILKKEFKLVNDNKSNQNIHNFYDQIILKEDLNNKKQKKTAVISLSKESNYREFYFLENFNNFPLLKIIKSLNKYDYKVIIRKHPKSNFNYLNLPNVINYNDSLFKLSKIVNINLHISTASHSFFDAISLNIPILIWSKKDLYSMKSLFPNYFIDDYEYFVNFLKNIDIREYNRNYNLFMQSLTTHLNSNKKLIKYDFLSKKENSTYFTKIIQNYLLNNF